MRDHMMKCKPLPYILYSLIVYIIHSVRLFQHSCVMLYLIIIHDLLDCAWTNVFTLFTVNARDSLQKS